MQHAGGSHGPAVPGAPSDWNGAISLLRAGSSAEIGQLLDGFRTYLAVIAEAELPRALAAKLGPSDLIQLTLARGQERIDDFRGESREELAAWLRQILRNHLRDAIKAYRREKRDIDREVSADSGLTHPRQLSPSGEAISSEEREALNAALQRLPEVYRQVIEFRHRDGLPFGELGRRLNRSEGAARKLWTRAIQRLQQELGNDLLKKFAGPCESR